MFSPLKGCSHKCSPPSLPFKIVLPKVSSSHHVFSPTCSSLKPCPPKMLLSKRVHPKCSALYKCSPPGVLLSKRVLPKNALISNGVHPVVFSPPPRVFFPKVFSSQKVFPPKCSLHVSLWGEHQYPLCPPVFDRDIKLHIRVIWTEQVAPYWWPSTLVKHRKQHGLFRRKQSHRIGGRQPLRGR